MACAVTSIDQTATCPDSDGGIYKSWITTFDDIDFEVSPPVIADSVLTAIAFTSGLVPFIYDDDEDSAYFNSEGERPTPNKHVYNQTAFMKFAGVNSAKVDAANKIVQCCALFAIHALNNGTIMVQGIEADESGIAAKISRKKARMVANVMTDTPANEDRVEFMLESQAKNVLTTDLTIDAIELLEAP